LFPFSCPNTFQKQISKSAARNRWRTVGTAFWLPQKSPDGHSCFSGVQPERKMLVNHPLSFLKNKPALPLLRRLSGRYLTYLESHGRHVSQHSARLTFDRRKLFLVFRHCRFHFDPCAEIGASKAGHCSRFHLQAPMEASARREAFQTREPMTNISLP